MSTPAPPAGHEGTVNGTQDLALDISKLHSLPSEQQDLYLFNFVCDLWRNVEGIASDVLPAHQSSIKKEIIKIIGLGTPVPSRAIRNNLGKIFADIFTRGSRSILYETINDILSIVSAGKGEKDVGTKHAAVVCLGQVFAAAGDSAISLSGLVCASLLKQLKPAQTHVGLRGSIYQALRSVVGALKSSIDESVARDIWKQAKNAASSDKAAFVQAEACGCLKFLATETSYFNNTADFDILKNTVWKVIDTRVGAVRYAAADTLACALAKAYSDSSASETVPIVRKPKKPPKKHGHGSDDDAVDERASSPAPFKSAVKLSLNLAEAFKFLSTQYCKSSTSNDGRAGVALCYKMFLQRLPGKVVQEKYGTIAKHILTDLLNHPTIIHSRYRLLFTRRLAKMILEEVVGASILNEGAQMNAARWLINDVLKNYPQVITERREPSKRTLTSALSALSSLASLLGSAMTSLQDSCREAVFQVLQHPSYTVQIHAAHCLQNFVLACPQQLSPSISICTTQMKKELDRLSESRQAPRRCVAYAHGLAGMLSACREQPLYGSVQVFSDTLVMATDLLKTSGSSELRASAVQVQVAWILIGGLMALGPSFVKVHLTQLLWLWRNASPKPLAGENTTKRGHLELSFLAQVRECALGSILAFLEFNSSLLTVDGSRRIANALQNSALFLNSLPRNRQTEDVSHRLTPTLQLQDHAILLRRRLLQCLYKLVGVKHLQQTEALAQIDLIGSGLLPFIDPENSLPKSLETSIASAANNAERIWDTGDTWDNGVNTIMRGQEPLFPAGNTFDDVHCTDRNSTSEEHGYSKGIGPSSGIALEHDSVALYCRRSKLNQHDFSPPATAVVNAAIALFAVAFPLQSSRVQEGSMEQLATAVAQPLQRDPGKRVAIFVNAVTALKGVLAVANGETSFSSGKLTNQSVERVILEVLRRAISDPEDIVRSFGASALGRLCNLSGSQFTSTEVNNVIQTIVANRDPHIRAGCAVALGSIHSQVGSLAAGLHLKSIVGVLLSLCNDPHPIVHFWAINAVTSVADSAGLAYSGYVASTLGMAAQLYSADSHNEEARSLGTSNLEMESSTSIALSRCVGSMINVLGPDLQDVDRTRNLVLVFVEYLYREEEAQLRVEGYNCTGHILLYAPAHVPYAKYVSDLQKGLAGDPGVLQEISIAGFNNLMKRNAAQVARVASSSFEEELWFSLDQNPGHLGLQSVLRSWMQQTYLEDTSEWVKQCQSILSKTKLKVESKTAPITSKSTAAPELVDEEVAGFAVAAAVAQGENGEAASEGQEFLRWQTRDFAMAILSELLDLVSQAMLSDEMIPAEKALQAKVADIVRIAFSASTANVVELRVWGLKIIDQLLKLFGKTPDPDFVEASLLEQYQAQIGSALTPAFATDSSPALAAQAIRVCATFVATGIVTNADRMGRIFKVLVNGLENFANDTADAAIGDLKGLSTNAMAMLKISILSSWAQLQLASADQNYLEDIVKPYVPQLAPLWLSSLQEYAALRFEPEISSTLDGENFDGDLNERYAAFNRETQLKYYQESWLGLVDAITVLVDKDSDAVFDALDGKSGSSEDMNADGTTRPNGKDMSFREEPVAFFFILFGLAFEALVTQAREEPSHALAILQALKKILKPAVSGNAIYEDVVFNETTDTLDRLALTSNYNTQLVLVEISRNLSLDHLSTKGSTDRDEKLSDDIEQLFELTRIILLVLSGLLPTLDDPPGTLSRPLSEEAIALVHISFQALVDVAEVFPSVIRADLHSCIIHCFCTMLATGLCQENVVPQIIPIFRGFLQTMLASGSRSESDVRIVRGCLRRLLVTLSHAQRRENEFALPCARNTLLAMTILFASAGHAISINDPLIAQAAHEFLDCLQDLGLAKVAANCIRTLMVANPKSPCEEVVARMLWPRLLDFISDSSAEDPENVRGIMSQSLTTSVSYLPAPGRAAAIALLVSGLLNRALKDLQSEVQKETAARLLDMAAADQVAFRGTIASLDDTQRVFLENILRSARGSGEKGRQDETEDVTDTKPTIELRMDF